MVSAVIRTSLDWEQYRAMFQGSFPMVHAPCVPPSYPVIITSMIMGFDENSYVSHTFYTVEDYENPDQASEYMEMLEDYAEFLKAVEEDLSFSLIQDSSKGE